MSSLRHADYRARSSRSQSSRASDRMPLAPAIANPDLASITPQDHLDRDFAPCTATGSFFLYAQKNSIVALHHDTLRIERVFDKHREDVLLIEADNVSDRGSGRLIVSYDAGQTAIVWDLLTGDEIARFLAVGDHDIRVASFMRDSSIAFGNAQGGITLFEPSTSENVATRTFFNPVTALAPAADCRIFAIGYLNGSVLIATLQPFTILHTLNTSRAPSPITGLAWHGSSSKQKTDMLATQTADGDLRVWSVAKPPSNEVPRIIRILQGPSEEYGRTRRSWFAWSKNGRLVQYSDGVARTWDVRTKRVTHEDIPIIDNVLGITNYGPTATLFTIGPNHTVQQYDINPQNAPMMVANVQHVPANAPPSPPGSYREMRAYNNRSGSMSEGMSSNGPSPPPQIEVESSEDDGPIQKMHREMDMLEEERKDTVSALSPVSSRASLSSASSSYAGRRGKSRKPSYSSKSSDVSGSSQHTFFSDLTSPSVPESQESISIRSLSSTGSSYARHTPSQSTSSRQQQQQSDELPLDLFPYTRARLTEVKFRAPQFGSSPTPDSLRQEMLSVVFGWDEDVETLIRTEQAYQPPGAPSIVLLSKWLGELGSDSLAQMVGSQSMSSSDWMLLALSMNMDSAAHKQMSEAFVTRLLRSNEIHPAVAILIGLGEIDEAIEAYVSRNHFLESILLTCLMFPADWQRQSYLVRKWGEASVADGYHEFAVRCFSCTSIESSEPWFSPRATDAVYAAQQKSLSATSPINSPPSATPSSRIAAKNASLGRLVTEFKGPGRAQPLNIGVTPIVDSALSPSGPAASWKRSTSRDFRDPSSARTATPGGYGRRRRGPSVEPGIREDDDEATPYASSRRLPSRPSSRLSSKDPSTAIKTTRTEELASPAAGAFRLRQEHSRAREGSRDRNPHRLQLQVSEGNEPLASSSTQQSSSTRHTRATRSSSSLAKETRPDDLSPLLTDGSSRSYKERSIDRYISSLEESAFHQSSLRADGGSRNDRSRSRPRQKDDPYGAKDTTFIKPSKRSPSSPAAMSTEDAHKFPSSHDSMEDERSYYGLTSPVESVQSTRPRAASKQPTARSSRREESPDGKAGARAASKATGRGTSRARQASPDRGRDDTRLASNLRSPSASSMDRSDAPARQTVGAGARARSRQRSSSRLAPSGRARSSSRRPMPEPRSAIERSTRLSDEFDVDSMPMGRPRAMSKKELAAKELEERRLSLARRPSAPAFPLPGDLSSGRPGLSPRAYTDAELYEQQGPGRSATVDPHEMRRYNPGASSGVSTSSVPIGLPATPRAMRHPRYMKSEPDAQNNIPAVPEVPATLLTLQPVSYQPSRAPTLTVETDGLGPLLPSTTYVREGPKRSSSAPPEKSMGQRPRRESFKNHTRQASEREGYGHEVTTSIDETINEEHNIIVVDEPQNDEHVLPELAHLSTPPPPPPPPPPPAFPGMTVGPPLEVSPGGIINIAIESAGPSMPGLSMSRTTTPATNSATAEHPTPSASPNLARKGHVSGDSISEQSSTSSSKWSRVRDRFRESSRSRRNTKSPQTPATATEPFNPSPYETIVSSTSFGRTKSPEYPQTSFSDNVILGTQLPSRPTPVGSPDGGYRNPKDIRANIPPEQLQAGVYVPLHETLTGPSRRNTTMDPSGSTGSNMI